MRIGPCKLLLALSLTPILLTQAASAQTNATAATSAACNCTAPVVPQHVQAYTAKQHSRHVQILANGTIITNTTDSLMARDADGRTRLETIRTLPDGTLNRYINIYDPVARVRITWSVGNSTVAKIVSVAHFPRTVSQPAPANPQSDQRYYPTSSRSLPPQTIDGLHATGTRSTRTTPAGYEGNNRDMTTTTVYWYSPALGIQLRSTIDDPRNGKSPMETTDIQQTAPDPALFKAPDGYQVRDYNP